MKPLILTAAINGGGPRSARAPHLPLTPREIADEAVASWRAGAAVVHLHGRGEDGVPTADVDVHRDIVARIRAAGCDAVLNVSAGDGGGRFDHAQRLALIGSGAEMVSFTASSYNSGQRVYDNAPGYLREACARMRAARVKPEVEVLDLGFLDRIARMVEAGDLALPMYCLLGFGIPGTMPPDIALLTLVRERLPAGAEWGVACAAEPSTVLTFQLTAFANGGHIRVGMEDQARLPDGSIATSNAQLIQPWVRTAQAWGRPIATPSQARDMLGLG